jgi:transcriptional regulator GlxA family with amidase domain
LLRHYRAAHGVTPLQYLHQARATRARMLLETTYLTVEAISEACGYRDAAMFRRVFSQATGLTPSAYREQFRLRPLRRDWGRDWRRNWETKSTL